MKKSWPTVEMYRMGVKIYIRKAEKYKRGGKPAYWSFIRALDFSLFQIELISISLETEVWTLSKEDEWQKRRLS